MRIKVWLYPANDVLGGTIEKRVIVDADDRKVYFEKGGAKRSSVFFTFRQAQKAKFWDLSEIILDKRKFIAHNVSRSDSLTGRMAAERRLGAGSVPAHLLTFNLEK